MCSAFVWLILQKLSPPTSTSTSVPALTLASPDAFGITVLAFQVRFLGAGKAGYLCLVRSNQASCGYRLCIITTENASV